MTTRKNRGFTLIEVALSIVIVALGVLAVFALISSGLTQSRKAVAETYAASFATDVFASLRAESLLAADQGEDAWSNHWVAVNVAAKTIPLPARTEWVGDQQVYCDGRIGTVRFQNYSRRASENTDIVNHALRYRVDIGSVVEYTAAVAGNTQRKTALLRVWDGELGITTNDRAILFYTEFGNPGDL